MQPVDTSKLKTVAVPSQADDPKLQALHPGKEATAAPPPPPPRGAPGIGKDLWDAADPARFLRRERRAVGPGRPGTRPRPRRTAADEARAGAALHDAAWRAARRNRARSSCCRATASLPPDSIVALAVNPALRRSLSRRRERRVDARTGLARDARRAAGDVDAPVLGLRGPGRSDHADTPVEQHDPARRECDWRWPAPAGWRC